ncbi:hypothetical protein [Escherichia coli]|uniref:hypothetical protein n=1 Tax=Escherichia coli TaxID=562 RepID=UPI000BB52848|nr:hypothetical protein [Escherichia coli]ATC02954.1 hypothetical protein CNQ50_13455 [Escherichia coli]
MEMVIFFCGFVGTMIVAQKRHLNMLMAFIGALIFWPAVLIYALCVNKRMFKHYVDAVTFVSMEFPNATDVQKAQVATYLYDNVYDIHDLDEARCRFAAYK